MSVQLLTWIIFIQKLQIMQTKNKTEFYQYQYQWQYKIKQNIKLIAENYQLSTSTWIDKSWGISDRFKLKICFPVIIILQFFFDFRNY